MFEGFTVTGSSLSLLQQGEQAVLSRLSRVEDSIRQELAASGLVEGVTITVEQRAPAFVVRVNDQPVVLSENLIRHLYVRLVNPSPVPPWSPSKVGRQKGAPFSVTAVMHRWSYHSTTNGRSDHSIP